MTSGQTSDAVPFWRRKSLTQFSETEWESICDGCGRCCLEKLQADDDNSLFPLDVGCELLDPATGHCIDYPNRLTRNERGVKLTPENIPEVYWLPPTCGYKRLYLGQDLPWWHPLVSGNPDTVRQAGISVVGRFIEPRLAGPWENHTIDWPLRDVTGDPQSRWETAFFGGVTASVPTPFGVDGNIELDLMAAHCFWLLANGCHNLAVLDHAGEVASLAIGERIAILEGLAEREVPVSKLLAGIGPAAPADVERIAACVKNLGIRGVMLTASVSGKPLPAEVFPKALLDRVRQVGDGLHVYLSLSVAEPAIAACLLALEALLAQSSHHVVGVRDERAGCALGLAALDRFTGTRFEVYTADDTALATLTGKGGAGLISPGANLFSRIATSLLENRDAERGGRYQRAIEMAEELLRSRPAVPALKALIARNAARPEWHKVRLPLRPPGAREQSSLFQAFDATGIRLRPVGLAEA